jgi:geranylgeranyl transferase type-2 subunit alpha
LCSQNTDKKAMHDQRKVKEELDEKARQFQEEKIQRFRTVYDTIFEHYRQGNLNRDVVLTLLDVLLEISPEQYTFFGYRRRILEASWLTSPKQSDQDGCESSDADGAEALRRLKTSDLEREYLLNTGVIMKDMKVYSAFVHRRWIFNHMTLERRRELLLGELKKCEALLKLDERNFHAWGYRRWVTEELRAATGVVEAVSSDATILTTDEQPPQQQPTLLPTLYTDADEWKFTEAKINQNFSNYSGWHNRGLLLERLIGGATTSSSSSLSSSPSIDVANRVHHEMDLALKAFYCDPNDQSAWLYGEFILRALLQRLLNQQDEHDEHLCAAYLSALRTMVTCCEELGAECAQERLDGAAAAAQQQCGNAVPQVLSGAYVLWMRLVIVLRHAGTFAMATSRNLAVPDDLIDIVTRWGSPQSLVEELTNVDPLRAGMYRAMAAVNAMAQ